MELEELRAIDAEIAIRIFGWKRGNRGRGDHEWLKPTDDKRYHGGFQQTPVLPRFSSDIAAAHEIVAKWDGDVLVRRQNRHWMCTFFQPSREWKEWAETEALAICKAALLWARDKEGA